MSWLLLYLHLQRPQGVGNVGPLSDPRKNLRRRIGSASQEEEEEEEKLVWMEAEDGRAEEGIHERKKC